MIYNTKIIDFIKNELNNDVTLFFETPFYQGDPTLKKGNLQFDLTNEEKEECWNVREDVLLLANKYCHSMTTEGVKQIQLYNFQSEYLRIKQKHRFIVTTASRQVGKTLMCAIHCIDALLKGKNVLIVTNIRDTGVEVLEKVKTIYRNMPFWLKPGVVSWNQSSFSLDNDATIMTKSRIPMSGKYFDLVYIDEAAFIPPNVFNNFYDSIYPIMSKDPSSQLIIQSTPNGYNRFYKIYQDAINNVNVFYPHRIDWNEVPGRDEKWKAEQIAIIGEEVFNSEFDLSFISLDLKEKFEKEKVEKVKEKSLLERLERIETVLNITKNTNEPAFNRDWVLKRMLGLSDDDIKKLGL